MSDAPAPDIRYARLRAYNPRKGFHVRRWGDADYLFEGGEEPRWYRVTAPRAAQLAALRQDGNDPDSKPLFEIATEEQKEAIDQEAALVRAAAARAPSVAVRAAPPLDATRARAAALPDRASSGDSAPAMAAPGGGQRA